MKTASLSAFALFFIAGAVGVAIPKPVAAPALSRLPYGGHYKAKRDPWYTPYRVPVVVQGLGRGAVAVEVEPAPAPGSAYNLNLDKREAASPSVAKRDSGLNARHVSV